MIKIDVEGFESEVLAGAKTTLEDPNVKAIIIELNGSGKRYGVPDDNIHAELEYFDFNAYNYDLFKQSLTPKIGYETHNTIYVRYTRFVMQWLENAAYVAVVGLKV